MQDQAPPDQPSIIDHLARIAANARDTIFRVDEVIRQLRQADENPGD
jgi:hypothetical protein